MNQAISSYGWTPQAPESTGYLFAAIAREVTRLKPRSILDLGCGNGTILRGLKPHAPVRCGCDMDEEGISLARLADPDGDYIQTKITTGAIPPLPSAPFDVIISTEVVEHLYSPDDLFFSAQTNAHHDTSLIITTPYHGWLKNVALAATNNWDKHHTALWTGGHIKFWSRRTLTELALRNKWEPVSFSGVGRGPYLWKSMLMVFRQSK
jgi:2-polyprenyl-3-methyl-5-hydroxy-6-metoxy-1,4-benzoquinol methylase